MWRHRAAACAAAALTHTCACSPAAGPGSSAADPPQWAHPSPYDPELPASSSGAARFADTRHLRTLRAQWDLPQLMAAWQAAGDGETWPWVWCQRNPTGPHHVFVGFGEGSLAQVRAVSAASAANNITVVLRGDELARCGVSEAELHALRCAIIYEAVAQIDVESRLLMLRDERVVAFDSAYLA